MHKGAIHDFVQYGKTGMNMKDIFPFCIGPLLVFYHKRKRTIILN